jgi:hypothetical protein
MSLSADGRVGASSNQTSADAAAGDGGSGGGVASRSGLREVTALSSVVGTGPDGGLARGSVGRIGGPGCGGGASGDACASPSE